MDQDAFVKGKRLIDPVTGKVEGDEESKKENDLDSFEMLERSSTSSKRPNRNIEMKILDDGGDKP